jgi:hypothetical protein
MGACVDKYPQDVGFTPDPTRCISNRTLYGTYYDWGGVKDANRYLAYPENPLESYPGVLFYRYAAAQFAYDYTRPDQLAHLPTAKVPSASPVRYDDIDPTNEKPLYLRRPDEGLDLLGHIIAALDSSGITQLPCNTSLPPTASVLDRIDCVLRKNIGRSFDELLLEYHTMLVLKDYVDDDERWRMEWLGDYNDGLGTALYPGAQSPKGIKGQKPFVHAISTKGDGFPPTLFSEMPDQLLRARRVQDTYTCVDPSQPCVPGSNLRVNTLAKGATLGSPQPVSLGKWGSAYVPAPK